jgi:hypothetical protein
MPNIKLIAVTITAISVSTILYLTSQQSAQDKVLERVFALHANATATRRNLAGGINPQWMGGGLEMGDGPWNEGNTLQLFSSTPNNPRQYMALDTEFIHWKNVSEQDAYGSTTFPPTESPTQMQMLYGGERPTPHPTEAYGGEWSREPSSRSPTKLPETSFRDDDDYEYEDDDGTRRPTKKPTQKPTRDPTREPTNEPTKEPTREPVSRNKICVYVLYITCY